ncbi:MAG: SGNH/GDSL hydrolase family protein [Anaerolinea sp.]
MKQAPISPLRRARAWLVNGLIMLISFGVAGLMALALAPVPTQRMFWTIFPPSTVLYREGMGDVLAYQHTITRPPIDPYRVLAIYPLAWDADGLRVPAHTAARYPIAVVGDSFSEGASVARPFPDGLATALRLPVRNLGVRATGPTEQALLVTALATEHPPEVLVMQFFGGNDISDTDSFTWRGEFVQPAVWRPQEAETPLSTRLWRYPYDDALVKVEKYPVYAETQAGLIPVNLLEGYLWAYNVTAEDLAASYALRKTRRAWGAMAAATQAACVIVLYVPSKEELYLPLIQPEDRARIFDTSYRNVVRAEGDIFRLEPAPDLTYEALVERLPFIGDAVIAAAEAEGYRVLDMRPIMHAAAQRGELLFYDYDTHLKQRGHDLIANALAQVVREC